MKQETIRQLIFKVARDVFEKAAFALTEQAAEADESMEGHLMPAVSLNFEGPFMGVMAMIAPLELGKMTAANMLGVDEEDIQDAGSALDALCELLNIVCGNFLPALAGSKAEFRIGAPAAMAPEAFQLMIETADNANAAASQLAVEGYLVRIVAVFGVPIEDIAND